jgi:hypothetical protein
MVWIMSLAAFVDGGSAPGAGAAKQGATASYQQNYSQPVSDQRAALGLGGPAATSNPFGGSSGDSNPFGSSAPAAPSAPSARAGASSNPFGSGGDSNPFGGGGGVCGGGGSGGGGFEGDPDKPFGDSDYQGYAGGQSASNFIKGIRKGREDDAELEQLEQEVGWQSGSLISTPPPPPLA